MPEINYAEILSSDELIQYKNDSAELSEYPETVFLVAVELAGNYVGIYPVTCPTIECIVFKTIKRDYIDEWSKKHPPAKILESVTTCLSKYKEKIDFMTLRYMYIYGAKYVRPMCGKYFEFWLNPYLKRNLEKINNMEFRRQCFCGENHTNMRDCEIVGCKRCDKLDHFYMDCPKKNKVIDVESLRKCMKCRQWGDPDELSCDYCGGPFEGTLVFEK